jgi:hypothetical protein
MMGRQLNIYKTQGEGWAGITAAGHGGNWTLASVMVEVVAKDVLYEEDDEALIQ